MFASPTSCPECGSAHILFDRVHDEVVCDGCGLIILEAIPVEGSLLEGTASGIAAIDGHGPVKNPFSVEGLSTSIDRRDMDATGRLLTPAEAVRAHRLRKLNRRTRMNNGTQRNLAYALHDIRQRGLAMGLPGNTVARAANLYSMAVEKKVTVGRNAQRLMAACVFIACREFGIPRAADEIASHFMPREKGALKARKHILKAKNLLMKELGIRQTRACPEQYVSRFCSELDLDVEVQAESGRLLRKASEMNLTDGNPVSSAATAIYVASRLKGKRVKQREVARITGITDATLRSKSRKLAEALGLSI